MARITLLLAASTAALAAGCGGQKTPATVAAKGPAPGAGVTTLPPEYRTVAARLGQPLRRAPADFRDDKDPADVMAEGHAAVLDFRAVRSDDPDIAYVASQAASAFADALARMERIKALPKPPSAGTVMVNSFIHGFYGNPYAGYELGADADGKQRAIADELTGAAAAVDKADAAHLLLARVAGRYAAPARGGPGRVAVEFDGAWNAWGPYDWCGLYNSGGDLVDCTVAVELRGAGGQTRTNVHFAARWPGRSWLYARYDQGTEVNGRRFERTTVPDPAGLRVRVLSPGFSEEVDYAYAGAEREKDVARRVAEVKPHIHSRVRKSAWGDSSGKVLVLENRWTHPVYAVGVRVVSAAGSPVGGFVKPRLDAGGSMEVGNWQVSRNLAPGDRVTVRLGEAELFTTVVQ